MADGGKTVLIIDDDVTIRKLLVRHLNVNEYNTLEAENAEEGMNCLNSNNIDLVLCDVTMGEMDGFAFCRKVRENENHRLIPFIFVTAKNTYEDKNLAESYSAMEFKNTYYLAYRDLPAILKTHVKGRDALDFGCGGGRSARFITGLGFNTLGIDNSTNMIKTAKKLDPKGTYQLVKDNNFHQIKKRFDLIQAIFTFDNIINELKIPIFEGLKGLLRAGGKILILVSTRCLRVISSFFLSSFSAFASAIPSLQVARPSPIVTQIEVLLPLLATHREVVYSTAGIHAAKAGPAAVGRRSKLLTIPHIDRNVHALAIDRTHELPVEAQHLACDFFILHAKGECDPLGLA